MGDLFLHHFEKPLFGAAGLWLSLVAVGFLCTPTEVDAESIGAAMETIDSYMQSAASPPLLSSPAPD